MTVDTVKLDFEKPFEIIAFYDLIKKYTEIKNNQRFIKVNPCAGGKRCQDFLIIKQEYWGDDMGQSVIDGYKD